MNKMDEDMKYRKYQMNFLELKTYSSLLRTCVEFLMWLIHVCTCH